MSSSSRLLRGIVVGVCAGCVPAFGQSVISGNFPSAWGPKSIPPPQHFFGPEYDGVSGIAGDGVIDHNGGTVFGGVGLIQLITKGTVVNTLPPDSPPDAFRWQISREQSFTLLEPANVVTPAFLKGMLTLGGAAAANFALVDARVEIYDATNSSVGAISQGMSRFGFSHGIGVFPIDTFDYAPVALPAGAYRVRATIEIGGQGGNISSPPGASAAALFFDDPEHGLVTSTAAYPDGLGSSRDAVRAPLARTTFGVDGTGVQVGLVETGSPYTTHSALSGAGKVTNITGSAGDFRREHALATAGIIAGADANPANAGIAPGATIVASPMASHASGFQHSVGSLLAANPAMRVMNMSATSGGGVADTNFINSTVNQKPNLTFVKSAGNAGTAGSVTVPGLAHNVITVGAVNRTFTARAGFSSYGAPAGTPMKPDIVAPGEYINAPQARDTNGDTLVNDFGRVFLGDDYRYTIAQSGIALPASGAITGTSFAAPHVAGAAALLHQYQMAHAATHEADHRVIKAVLLNSATTSVSRFGGAPWSQATTGTLPGMSVTRSLDEELGAGMLDTLAALRQYQPDEVRLADDNSSPNFNIDASINLGFVWDLERVVAGGRVNYLLGDITGRHLRSTLTWDNDVFGGTGLQPLELRFYAESVMMGGVPGFDATDLLLISTPTVGENVKLIDFASVLDLTGSGQYYMQVYNAGTVDTTFGIALMVPEPWAGLMLGLGIALRRSRRAA